MAIKVLQSVFTADRDRLARFEREARVLATLNHPHIGAIYGLEDADGTPALVLELVEGETLAEKLAHGLRLRTPLSVGEALAIASQIAEALEAAHEQGIIHRDLKPANIKVRADGTVKVLDFGLAKLAGADLKDVGQTDPAHLANSPTLTSPTIRGAILGTAPYMSPEQARGKAVDKRSDIWGFGCVLYEMLTGVRAFRGDDITETLASVVAREPDWSKLPAATPAAISKLLRRCLAKDPRERLHDIADARLEIADVLSHQDRVTTVESANRQSGRLPWAIAAMALAGLIGVAAFVAYERRQTVRADARTFRTSILLPPDLNLVAASASRFALSPDGRRLALSAPGADGRLQLWVRSLDALTAQPLSGTLNAQYPCWSPDGRFIAFVAQGTLKKIDASGGPATTLNDSVSTGSLTWNESDVILFNRGGESPGIYRVAASGGQAVAVTHVDRARGEIEHALPWFLPDGNHFLYYLSSATGSGTGAPTGASGGTFVGSLDSREESKPLLPDGVSAKYADGYLLFTRASTLMAQRLDPDRLTLGGEAAPIAEQLDVSGVYSQSAFSVSSGSTLAYQSRVAVQSQLTWFDRSGKRAGTVGPPGDYGSVDLSPDRARAAVSVLEPGGRSRDLWLFDMTRGDRTQITFGEGEDYYPVWSPDGSQIIFASRQLRTHDLYRKASSGAGGEEPLYADEVTKFPFGWSPDGRLLVYNSTVNTPGSGSDMLILPIAENAKPSIFLRTPFSEGRGTFSPDGRWLAYVSNETGRSEVYVTSFPGPRGKWRVSADGGDYPRSRRDGRELFFIGSESRLMNAAVNGAGAAFEVGAVTRMFELRRRVSEAGRAFPGHGYDVSADGQRILVNVRIEDSGATPITLLTNWITLVKH